MKLPLNFELVTRRCRLRLPDETDIPHVFSATRYAGFNDGMLWDPPASEEELREPLERNLDAWKAGEAFTFTIERKEDHAFIGRIGIRPTLNRGGWNIGFWVHPRHQGQGFMTEAAQAVVDFGFETLGAGAIEARYATWNDRSRKVLERVGMTEVEYIAHGYQKRGAWVPEFRMRIEKKQKEPDLQSPLQTAVSITPAASSDARAAADRGAPGAPPPAAADR